MRIEIIALLLALPVCMDAAASDRLTTLVGAPEVMGGPACCLFDSPLAAVRRADATTLAYTANSQSYVWSRGASVSDQLAAPAFTGLGPDPDAGAYSHCGKWINAAWVDAQGAAHAFYHQEWNCDYAKGGYTNKSIAYAVSTDGGLTFAPQPMPGPGNPGANQIIAGNNFSSTHQTGEGDHSVFQLGDFLYLFFIEWDGPEAIHGGTTAGVARSAVADAGRPGTWRKYYKGAFAEPGVGGHSDSVDIPGTSIVPVPAVGQLIATGVIFSAALNVAWCDASDPPVSWRPAPSGPMFNADWSSWDRTINSSELFGYPALTGPQGTNNGIPTDGAFVYFTYLAPGTDFTQRYLVRRPLEILEGSASNASTVALAALSVWSSAPAQALRLWPTTGPITPPAGYNLSVATLAYLPTWAPPAPAPQLAPLRECLLQGGAHAPAVPIAVALTRDGECGAQGTPFAAGTYLRTSGWAAGSVVDAEALGWGMVTQPASGQAFGATPGALWRCVGSGPANFTVTFSDETCAGAGAGWRPDVLLGYALSPLTTL
jgi:hypothetical protein